MELAPAELQEILRIFVDSDLEEMHLEVGDVRLVVAKDSVGARNRLDQPAAGEVAEVTTTSRATEQTPADEISELIGETPSDDRYAVAVEPSPSPESRAKREGLFAVRSPLLGVFYQRPAPNKPPYVEVGQTVVADTPVCTISVMKMYTEVTAGCAGRIIEICVENGILVEYGQVLMYIEPASEGS